MKIPHIILPAVLIVAFILVGCDHQDPIGSIVKKASADPIFPASDRFATFIQLPATAPVAEVTSRALGLAGTNVTIVEIRQVQIANADKHRSVPTDAIRYTAVLVDTSDGKKVVLLQFQPDNSHPPGSWFFYVYDIQPSA
jgi:hypothetical protein